ncbi:hypothetical protein HYC85_030040 [Camellia sinensis]|uniref:Uncharacterized protein n=1 Tax=Camellia sinensis TaxID=4442 RepID=A0A7J7FZS2_CAMSI|nr:hypothetical protein HYC85_030040 [Camellia sinensis]
MPSFPFPVYSTSFHHVPLPLLEPRVSPLASLYSITLRGWLSSWSVPPLGHPSRSALLVVGPSTRSPFAVGPPHGRSLHSVTRRGLSVGLVPQAPVWEAWINPTRFTRNTLSFFLHYHIIKRDTKTISEMEPVFLSRENVDEGEEINVQYASHAHSSKVQQMIAKLNSRVHSVQHMKQIEKGGRSIFKVPLSIKKLDTDAFVPHIVSIGPYHWHKKHLMEMETCKSILLDHVLKRAGMKLTTLKRIMYELEAARKHYDQPFENIKRDDFVEMMLHDACFILELFCIEASRWENYGHTSDPYILLNMTGFMPFVRRDLLMLENQLPLPVLQKMFTVLDWKQRTPKESIDSLAIKFFKKLIPGISKNQPKHVKNRPPPTPEEENRPTPPCGHLKNRKPAAAAAAEKENRPRPPPAAEENRLPLPRAAAAENRSLHPPPPHPENRPPSPPHPENKPPPPPPPPHPEIRPSPSPSPRPPPPRPPPPPTTTPPPPPPCLHLLDIVHKSLKPSLKPSPSANLKKHWICTHGNCLISSLISLPCFSMTICVQDSDLERVSFDPPDIVMPHSVTSLRSTGIGFKENKNCEKFTDIQFDHKNGMLLIPRLHINGSTRSILLNLMVFEQGNKFCSRYITSYTIFMDGLVDSAKDAQHLIEKQIIYHELGSEDNVATLFNSLRREIYFIPDDCYLRDVSQKLDEHYQQKWRSWIATLKHEYLKDPWKTISLIAAALLILLTITQTAYTVVAYHLPRP